MASVCLTSSTFEYLAANAVQHNDLAVAYDQVIRCLLAAPVWSGGAVKERRVLWTDAVSARRADSYSFKRPGLYIWGVEDRPIYIGMTESSFGKRFSRYIWNERSQCNLAREFGDALIENGIEGFPEEIREWYAKDYRGSTVRLKGAVRFASEGIGNIWFVLLPAGDPERIQDVEKALIPVATQWNMDAGIKPLLNIQSNRSFEYNAPSPCGRRSDTERKKEVRVRIERGIPIPEVRTKSSWPWKELEVGDSFEAEIEARSMYPTAIRAGERHAMRFVVRSTGEGKCRVWRAE